MDEISKALLVRGRSCCLDNIVKSLDRFYSRIRNITGVETTELIISFFQTILSLLKEIVTCRQCGIQLCANVFVAVCLPIYIIFGIMAIIAYVTVSSVLICLLMSIRFLKKIYICCSIFKEIGYLSFTGMRCIKDKEKKIESLLEAFTGNEAYFGNCLNIDLHYLSLVPDTVIFSIDQQLSDVSENIEFDYESLCDSMMKCLHKLTDQELTGFSKSDQKLLQLQKQSNELNFDSLPVLIERLKKNDDIAVRLGTSDQKMYQTMLYNRRLYSIFKKALDDDGVSNLEKVNTLINLSNLVLKCPDIWSSEVYHDMKKWFVTEGSFHDIVLSMVQEFKEKILQKVVAKYSRETWHVINDLKNKKGIELGLNQTSQYIDSADYECSSSTFSLLYNKFIQEYIAASDELIVYIKDQLIGLSEIAYKANIYLEEYIQSLEDRRGQAFTKQKPGCSTPAFVMDELINIDEGIITEKGVAIILLKLGILK